MAKSTERRDVASYTDWRGRTVRVGSLVLYPRTSGRSVELMEGTVVAIFQTRSVYSNAYDPDATYSEWSKERTAIRPIRSSRFNSEKSWRGGPKKDAIILDRENVTRIDPTSDQIRIGSGMGSDGAE